MVNTELSLEVSKGNNQKVMRLFDTSYYYSDQPVENYLIEVLPVNRNNWVVFNVAKNFSLVLNSSNLQYKKVSDEDCLIDLPDGIYEFKQSIKPNSAHVVHFYHLRNTELLNKIRRQRNKLYNEECKLSRQEFKDNRDKLRDIEEYAMAAQYMVDECLNKVKGKELYEFAAKLLERYSNECQCK